jgi:putative PIN family toxin of toxin-antitoxin system
MKVNRVVVDTNILISALLSRTGTPRLVLDAVIEQGVLLFSDETYQELITRLERSKFDRYVTPEQKEDYYLALIEASQWVKIEGVLQGCRDIDDDKFLETALVGEADLLLSGDQDLLQMDGAFPFPIMSAISFLKDSSHTLFKNDYGNE